MKAEKKEILYNMKNKIEDIRRSLWLINKRKTFKKIRRWS